MGVPKKKDNDSDTETKSDFDDFLDELAKDQTRTDMRAKLARAQKEDVDVDESTEQSIPGQDGTKLGSKLEVLEALEVNKPKKDDLPTLEQKAENFKSEDVMPVIHPVAGKKSEEQTTTQAKKLKGTQDIESDTKVGGFEPAQNTEPKGKAKVESLKAVDNEVSSGEKNEFQPDQKIENTSTGTSNLVSASIKQANHLKVAQDRINELDDKLLKLKQENESLSVSSNLLDKQVVDLTSRLQTSNSELKNFKENLSEDKKVLTQSISDKQSKIDSLTTKIETLESRLKQENYNVRTRERELENRLELVRSEKNTLLKDKDSTILSFKREIDKLNFEMDSYRDQQKELKAKILASDERIKKSVRALRVALGILEGTDE